MSLLLDCLLAALLTSAVRGEGKVSEQLREGQDSVAVDLGEDGSYGFRYHNADQGGHYGEAAATPDNTVNGKFGYREPGTGRNLETRYTAGERGFRAQGPSIHRRMDLSQVKVPYNPPVPQDSPAYNPSYSTYYDPNEDSSYHFDFSSNEYKRTETGGPLGQVAGSYAYVDDAGDIHNVEFEAGSQTGFHIKTPHPDSNHNYNDLFFRGDGKVPLRGRTSIQRGLDGSYRFTSHSQDQRRSEVKDAQGNTRGSYTYIDKDGTQRTVQYIAGANIGYKIINQGLGPSLDTQYPFINPNYVPPSLLGAGDISGFGVGTGSTTISPTFGSKGGVGGVKRPRPRPPSGSSSRPRPRPTSPPFSTTTSFGFDSSSSTQGSEDNSLGGEGGSSGQENGNSFNSDGNFLGVEGEDNGSNDSSGVVAGGNNPFGGGGGSPFGDKTTFGGVGTNFGSGGSSTFRPEVSTDSTSPSPPFSCCRPTAQSPNKGSEPFSGTPTPTGRPQNQPPYPPSGQKPQVGLSTPTFRPTRPSLNDKRPPPARPGKPSVDEFLSPGYPPPPHAGFPEEESLKPFEKPAFKPFTVEDNLFLQKPFSSLPPPGTSGFYPDRVDEFHRDNAFASQPDYFEGFNDKDGAFSHREFTGFPPGVSVKGRVQSLDVYPYGTKVPNPGEAIEHIRSGRPEKRRS